MEKQERYYDILKLNKLFGISSIAFLVLLIWTFADDYDRDWKDYQKEFRKIQTETISGFYEDEKASLDVQEDYQEALNVLKQSERELAEKEGDYKVLQKQLQEIEALHYKTEQNLSFVKAEMDAAKYQYEEALGKGHGDVELTKRVLNELDVEVHQIKLELEEVDRQLGEQKKVNQQFTKNIDEEKKTVTELSRNLNLHIRKLKKIDPAFMNIGNKAADFVRDLPVLDFLNPYYKVEQIVIKDITDDIIFMQVPKVDRCVTCHLGIDLEEFEDAPQPFKTHPNLDLYLSSGSAHPINDYGCTGCHGGRGRGTDFVTSAHTPSSEHQEEEWIEKYAWQEMEFWSTPMYSLNYTEAGCVKCHVSEVRIKEADKLNKGLALIEKAGCFGCHLIDRLDGREEVGPDLTHLASKTTKEWAYLWIKDPKSFRHNTWMPRFFNLLNNSSEKDVKRTEQEIHSIVNYLFEQSTPYEMTSLPRKGSIERGEDLFNNVGCRGCHIVQEEPDEVETTLKTLRQQHGPNLTGLKTKTTTQWVYNWIKNPNSYHDDSRMPNLRLSDMEAADISAYLTSMKNEEFIQQNIPEVNEHEIDNIAMQFLLKMNSDRDAKMKLRNLNLEGKLLYTGEKLIRQYGCFGCHNIPGYEKDKPIGTELTEEGSKPIEKLDFGFIPIEQTRQAWFTHKLLHPRSFDKDKVRSTYDKLRMPNFDFTEDEVEAIVTALLGFTKESSIQKELTPQTVFVEKGQWLVNEFNCQGCHIIENEGGDIADIIGLPEFSPPNLNTEGIKVHPDWLLEFFKDPITIRPNLRVRMPSFNFSEEDWNSIIQYFQYRDEQFIPYESPHTFDKKSIAFKAGEKLQEMGECNKCHFYGTQFPTQTAETWAPNLAMSKYRLRSDWIVEWLRDPQAIMPGTKMPKPFIPTTEDIDIPEAESLFGKEIVALNGDEEAMLEGLTEYTLSIKGKSDISNQVKDFFDKNGYDFMIPKEEEEEYDKWEDW